MDVYSCDVEATNWVPGVSIDLTIKEASMLRRILYFNKTVCKRVAERDGDDAGARLEDFFQGLGNRLADEGIERWDGRNTVEDAEE